MTKAADIVGPITLTVLVNDLLFLVVLSGFGWESIGLTHFSSGVTGDQQGSVRGDSGDHRGDEEEQEPSSL